MPLARTIEKVNLESDRAGKGRIMVSPRIRQTIVLLENSPPLVYYQTIQVSSLALGNESN